MNDPCLLLAFPKKHIWHLGTTAKNMTCEWLECFNNWFFNIWRKRKRGDPQNRASQVFQPQSERKRGLLWQQTPSQMEPAFRELQNSLQSKDPIPVSLPIKLQKGISSAPTVCNSSSGLRERSKKSATLLAWVDARKM